MRVKMTILVLAMLFCVTSGYAYAAPEPGYLNQLGKTFTRGIKNVVSFPWEIPSTIGEYDRKTDGNSRAFRDMAGFVDGAFRAVTRLGCGVWDVFSSIVPGQQDSLPLKPETFF